MSNAWAERRFAVEVAQGNGTWKVVASFASKKAAMAHADAWRARGFKFVSVTRDGHVVAS